MNAAAIQAEYADYKRVKGRKVLQLICEVPIEDAPKIHKMLGEPAFGERQINVAIAKLDMAAVTQEQEKPTGKSYAQQAALVCKEGGFWKFLWEAFPEHCLDGEPVSEEMAKQFLYNECRIQSRAELIEGTPEGDAFYAIRGHYQSWLNL